MMDKPKMEKMMPERIQLSEHHSIKYLELLKRTTYRDKKVVIYKEDEFLECFDFVLKIGYGNYNDDFECYGDCSIVVKDMKMLFEQLLK